MELSTIFIRTIMIYFVVFIVLRIMGKREIGKLSVFDLVISIMIAEIAVFVIEDLDKKLIEGLLPMFILVVVQIVMAYITLKSRRLRILFDGQPSVLIDNGKMMRAEMKKQKYSIDDLLLQLRENGVRSVEDVDVAVLETNGKLSVILKETEESFAQTSDESHHKTMSHDNVRLSGLPLPLIMDGQVQEGNLAKINRDHAWLKLQIRQHGADEFSQVFFCSFDHKGKIFVNHNE